VVSWDVKSSVNYAVTLLREKDGSWDSIQLEIVCRCCPHVCSEGFDSTRVSRTFFPFKFALTIRCFY
jgi:hypothetical protein